MFLLLKFELIYCEKLHETFVFKCYLLCNELPCNCSASDTFRTFFVQNQYFVTVAKAESASDAFLESREREMAVAGRNQATVQQSRAAWREES